MTSLFRPAALVALLALSAPVLASKPVPELTYTVRLDPATNSNAFQVQLTLPKSAKLRKDQAVYQFAATAPGTYQVMDMGRYVSNFQAFDAKGKPLEAKQISTNQWQLSQPEKTREIRYTIAETWDTEVKEHNIYRMCGSSLETDHALLNGQTLLGYPQGMQGQPLRLKLEYPSAWKAGSVLQADKDGYYHLRNYDHAVDSPILLGRLTEASTKLGTADVALYCYSATDQVQAEPLLGYMQKMLTAAQSFFGGQLPVQRYAFLYHFADRSAGAWEHSYSSEYVLREQPLTPESAQGVVDIAAHEFFHVMTPLNIHSEVIEQFNFVQPTGSEHLWLYEGTTEWASHMMQLRGGLVSLDDYLGMLRDKVQYDRTRTDTTYSLSRLGLNSFSDEGQRQYGNIYQRGALTAGLLDLRLLELSGGKRGLRDVLLELARQYGPNKPISEKNFFQDFTKLTYPEIGDFFRRYVQNAEPLPLQEYYATVGVRYEPIRRTGKQVATLGTLGLAPRETSVYVTKVGGPVQAAGLQVGDQLLAVDGVRNDFTALRRVGSRAPGSELALTIGRNGQEQTLRVKLGSTEEVQRYVFRPDPAATPAQLAQRAVWLKNL